mgnify:CR=1 FL=1
MKKLEGLAAEIKILPNEGEDLSKVKIPIMRSVLTNIVANTRGITGEKSIRLTKIGLALLVAKDTLELEDADFELLREIAGQPGPYVSFIMGQALDLLNETSKKS